MAESEKNTPAPASAPAEQGGTEQGAEQQSSNSGGLRQNITGKQKAAMLLISIGPEKSAEILRHLKKTEINIFFS